MTTAMGDPPNDPIATLDERWAARRKEWARRLGRLQLGVEPIQVQVARYRNVTWGLSAVAATIGLMFVTLFTAFSRPDVGLILVAVMPLPLIVFAWIGQLRLGRQARDFESEFAAYQAERRHLIESADTSATNETPRSA